MKKIMIPIIASIIIVIDQLSKFFIVNNIEYLSEIDIIGSFFRITNIKNTGASFSILSGNTIFLALIGLLCLIVISIYIKRTELNKFESIAVSFVIGGLIGNLIDRLFKGGVIDFFSFSIFNYDFPIFNVADIFIVVGVFLIILINLRGEKNENRKRKLSS